jgi:cytochrome o ubiquinol oxidase operon protein cyoD
VGFGLAVVLTLIAFGIAMQAHHGPSSALLIAGILTLAMIQLVIQLIFFLHLGRDVESRWHTALFVFTFSGILLVVLASVWIMYHLNYNMTPMEMNQYIGNQSTF